MENYSNQWCAKNYLFILSITYPRKKHGPIRSRFTLTNLLEFTIQAIIEAIESDEQMYVVNTDGQKTFDRISHKILLNTLSDGCSLKPFHLVDFTRQNILRSFTNIKQLT